jgi:hypothetical protein
VVFSCYPEGASGPDGLPFLFYQKYWECLKHDIFKLFRDFQGGSLKLFRLNFAMLTLIPKVENACEIKKNSDLLVSLIVVLKYLANY